MEKIYYYKRSSGTWVFCVEGQTIVKQDTFKGAQYHRMLRFAKKELWRLYLDLPEDFEKIKKIFFTPEYWEGRDWKTEDDL